MAELAAVIIAHNNPGHVRRLIDALDGVDVFLHCDRRSSDEVLRQMLDGRRRDVHVVHRTRTALSSWSLLEAELIGVRSALERSDAQHLIVCSGSCYPLLSTDGLLEELAPWRGRSRMEFRPLPWRQWSRRENGDGGLWRFDRRFVTVRGRVVMYRGVPLRTFRQEIPREIRLHASGGWKIYAREHAAAVLRVLDERPDHARFWRHTFIPSESCVASILGSPALVGDVAELMLNDPVWYTDWGAGPDDRVTEWHPSWLGVEDFARLEAVRRAPPRPPGVDGDEHRYRKLFARKFAPEAAELVRLVDERLRD